MTTKNKNVSNRKALRVISEGRHVTTYWAIMGEILRACMVATRHTQRTLAEQIGCSPGHVSMMVRGRAIMHTPYRHAIAAAMGIGGDEMLELTERMTFALRRWGVEVIEEPSAVDLEISTPAIRSVLLIECRRGRNPIAQMIRRAGRLRWFNAAWAVTS